MLSSSCNSSSDLKRQYIRSYITCHKRVNLRSTLHEWDWLFLLLEDCCVWRCEWLMWEWHGICVDEFIQVQSSLFYAEFLIIIIIHHHHHWIAVKPHYFTVFGSKNYCLELCRSELSDFAVHGWLKHLCLMHVLSWFSTLKNPFLYLFFSTCSLRQNASQQKLFHVCQTFITFTIS
jgi:hypothetical protein